MRKDWTKYNFNEIDLDNLKVTYFLGAGASYNAVPIWRGQGESMKDVAQFILAFTEEKVLSVRKGMEYLYNNPILINLAKNIQKYGELAIEFGSIDIYAKRLELLGDKQQLNELKYCLSIYFDLWENFVSVTRTLNDDYKYSKIDKRYLSLLSVLLEKGIDKKYPRLHKNISFVSWNYDLQMEMAYESFMEKNALSLEQINDGFSFLDGIIDNEELDIIHLNGSRGYFKTEKQYKDNVPNLIHGNKESYFMSIVSEDKSFKKRNYSNCIKYAWEQDSNVLEKSLKLMENTDILVIIGYSFPSFNRKIDTQLINKFQANDKYLDIIVQDPEPNQDIINALFDKPENVQLKTNLNQFYIPHEFLFPPERPKSASYFIV